MAQTPRRTGTRLASIWDVGVELPARPALAADARAEVCVVGGGIAGLSAAYFLARAGHSVIVLETAELGAGDTGLTTAHLASAMDDRFVSLERLHGERGSRLAYESHQAAIETIGEVARAEGIDCDYVRLDGCLFLAPGDDRSTLEAELAAAHRAGFSDAELLPQAPGQPFETGPCLRFPRQARFHPLCYLQGLAAAIERHGGTIHTGTRVVGVEGGDRPRVRSELGPTVAAAAVIVATNAPISDRVWTHARQAPYRTYAVAGAVPPGAVADALLWDTGDPYHYVRLQRVRENGHSHEVLIVGGEDHPVGEEHGDEPWRRLEAWTRERYPVASFERRWAGQVMEPVDGLASIGPDPLGPRNVYVHTGDSGQGMTHGTLGGMLLADLVRGVENPWATLYDPSRLSLRAGGELLRTAAHMARHYAEWLTGVPEESGAAEAPTQVPRGSGRVVRRAGRALAVYVDEQGTIHERSAACTHLGCIVHWNDEDRTWDCPCHGSRFAPTGEPLHGPARTPLGRE